METSLIQSPNPELTNLILDYIAAHPSCIYIDKDSLKGRARFRARIIFRANSAALLPIAYQYCNTKLTNQKEIELYLIKRCERGILKLSDDEVRKLLKDYESLLFDNPRILLITKLLSFKSIGGGPGRGHKSSYNQESIYNEYIKLNSADSTELLSQ